ncbi:olfactory receptor 52D1-like [Erpetoichthys calabaricus]|uniref:olfactory receptor 52D1-like n=1 Tax=Erpetoichthys calabaricus TaxID=27687 RepID=UPI002233F09E|nr:olfactory receptor 52D1-like [Erpetoichthys calabaricus]
MENGSSITTFLFTAYGDIGFIKNVYFTVTIITYLLIHLVNTIVIIVIVRDRTLHEPMYIFICCLTINCLYGSNAFYPKFLDNLLSDNPSISRTGCLLQIFAIHTYGSFEFSILALMAYDRYVSICNPLLYNNIMKPSKVTRLLCFTYLYPVCIFTVHILLTIRLPICGYLIDKVYCDNWSVVRLSCVDISINSAFGWFVTTVLMVPPLMLILYSYIKIISVSVKASKESRSKAVKTCLPHLITFLNYCIATSFEILHQRFDARALPHDVRVFMSIDFVLLPPLLNPVIYGVKTKKIWESAMKMFNFGKMQTLIENVWGGKINSISQ